MNGHSKDKRRRRRDGRRRKHDDDVQEREKNGSHWSTNQYGFQNSSYNNTPFAHYHTFPFQIPNPWQYQFFSQPWDQRTATWLNQNHTNSLISQHQWQVNHSFGNKFQHHRNQNILNNITDFQRNTPSNQTNQHETQSASCSNDKSRVTVKKGCHNQSGKAKAHNEQVIDKKKICSSEKKQLSHPPKKTESPPPGSEEARKKAVAQAADKLKRCLMSFQDQKPGVLEDLLSKKEEKRREEAKSSHSVVDSSHFVPELHLTPKDWRDIGMVNNFSATVDLQSDNSINTFIGNQCETSDVVIVGESSSSIDTVELDDSKDSNGDVESDNCSTSRTIDIVGSVILSESPVDNYNDATNTDTDMCSLPENSSSKLTSDDDSSSHLLNVESEVRTTFTLQNNNEQEVATDLTCAQDLSVCSENRESSCVIKGHVLNNTLENPPVIKDGVHSDSCGSVPSSKLEREIIPQAPQDKISCLEVQACIPKHPILPRRSRYTSETSHIHLEKSDTSHIEETAITMPAKVRVRSASLNASDIHRDVDISKMAMRNSGKLSGNQAKLLKDDVIHQLLNMSKTNLKDLVNNPRSRKLEFAVRHLVKEHRMLLSRELRLLAQARIREQQCPEAQDHFQEQDNLPLDPDLAINLSNLPMEFIEHLGDILQINLLDGMEHCDINEEGVLNFDNENAVKDVEELQAFQEEDCSGNHTDEVSDMISKSFEKRDVQLPTSSEPLSNINEEVSAETSQRMFKESITETSQEISKEIGETEKETLKEAVAETSQVEALKEIHAPEKESDLNQHEERLVINPMEIEDQECSDVPQEMNSSENASHAGEKQTLFYVNDVSEQTKEVTHSLSEESNLMQQELQHSQPESSCSLKIPDSFEIATDNVTKPAIPLVTKNNCELSEEPTMQRERLEAVTLGTEQGNQSEPTDSRFEDETRIRLHNNTCIADNSSGHLHLPCDQEMTVCDASTQTQVPNESSPEEIESILQWLQKSHKYSPQFFEMLRMNLPSDGCPLVLCREGDVQTGARDCMPAYRNDKPVADHSSQQVRLDKESVGIANSSNSKSNYGSSGTKVIHKMRNVHQSALNSVSASNSATTHVNLNVTEKVSVNSSCTKEAVMSEILSIHKQIESLLALQRQLYDKLNVISSDTIAESVAGSILIVPEQTLTSGKTEAEKCFKESNDISMRNSDSDTERHFDTSQNSDNVCQNSNEESELQTSVVVSNNNNECVVEGVDQVAGDDDDKTSASGTGNQISEKCEISCSLSDLPINNHASCELNPSKVGIAPPRPLKIQSVNGLDTGHVCADTVNECSDNRGIDGKFSEIYSSSSEPCDSKLKCTSANNLTARNYRNQPPRKSKSRKACKLRAPLRNTQLQVQCDENRSQDPDCLKKSNLRHGRKVKRNINKSRRKHKAYGVSDSQHVHNLRHSNRGKKSEVNASATNNELSQCPQYTSSCSLPLQDNGETDTFNKNNCQERLGAINADVKKDNKENATTETCNEIDKADKNSLIIDSEGIESGSNNVISLIVKENANPVTESGNAHNIEESKQEEALQMNSEEISSVQPATSSSHVTGTCITTGLNSKRNATTDMDLNVGDVKKTQCVRSVKNKGKKLKLPVSSVDGNVDTLTNLEITNLKDRAVSCGSQSDFDCQQPKEVEGNRRTGRRAKLTSPTLKQQPSETITDMKRSVDDTASSNEENVLQLTPNDSISCHDVLDADGCTVRSLRKRRRKEVSQSFESELSEVSNASFPSTRARTLRSLQDASEKQSSNPGIFSQINENNDLETDKVNTVRKSSRNKIIRKRGERTSEDEPLAKRLALIQNSDGIQDCFVALQRLEMVALHDKITSSIDDNNDNKFIKDEYIDPSVPSLPDEIMSSTDNGNMNRIDIGGEECIDHNFSKQLMIKQEVLDDHYAEENISHANEISEGPTLNAVKSEEKASNVTYDSLEYVGEQVPLVEKMDTQVREQIGNQNVDVSQDEQDENSVSTLISDIMSVESEGEQTTVEKVKGDERIDSSSLLDTSVEDVDKDSGNFYDAGQESGEGNSGMSNRWKSSRKHRKERKMDAVEQMEFTFHSGSILDIKTIGRHILAACADGNVYCYSAKSGKLKQKYEGHSAGVISLLILEQAHNVLQNCDAAQEDLLFTGSLDNHLRCFTLERGTEVLKEPVNAGSPIQCMDESWGTIFLGTKAGEVARFFIKSLKLAGKNLKCSEASIMAVKATREGPRNVLIVATRNDPLSIRDASTGLLMRIVQLPHIVFSLLLDTSLVYCGTKNGKIIAFSFADSDILLSRMQKLMSILKWLGSLSGEEVCKFQAGNGVVCMKIYNNLLFAACYDGNIYIYSLQDKSLITSVTGGKLMLCLDIVKNRIIAGSKFKLQAAVFPAAVRNYLKESKHR